LGSPALLDAQGAIPLKRDTCARYDDLKPTIVSADLLDAHAHQDRIFYTQLHLVWSIIAIPQRT
jgi:hypothetical protein